MEELKTEELRAMARAMGLKVIETELPDLTVRFNGMLALLEQLQSLPIEKAEIIPTLLTQRGD